MNHRSTVTTLVILVNLSACQFLDDSTRLHALFNRTWEFRLTEDPLLATLVGHNEFNDQLPSITPKDHQSRTDFYLDSLQTLNSINRANLDWQDLVSLRIFEHELRESIEANRFSLYEIPLTADSGFHISFGHLPTQMPFQTPKDFENYIARLTAFPTYVDQHVANMQLGLMRGMTLPQVVLQGYELTISAQVVDRVEKSVFYKPFEIFPPSFTKARREQLRTAGTTAILNSVIPGYRTFLNFMIEDYIPNARATIGASELPNGQDYYEYLVRHFTTLDLSIDKIHQIGLDEVERIQDEMLATMQETGFHGDFSSFLAFLRTNPKFYARTPEELLKQASFLAKTMDAKLPSLFKTLPRLPYGVAPVPNHLAPKYTSGRYVRAPQGGTEPGYYWVNTYSLENRPLYVLEALTLHEAVPGHHLQIALSQEQKGVPAFRRHSYFPAFGEGWGLYAERLGLEVGFYEDPYSNFGRLTYEMWRACRLVVDTGIHSKGWTRQQAINYLASHVALSLHEIRTEIDRYISWPGQALAYKIGELTILRLRQEAEKALGMNFDIREFHDIVLSAGSVPLPILESLVTDYIDKK